MFWMLWTCAYASDVGYLFTPFPVEQYTSPKMNENEKCASLKYITVYCIQNIYNIDKWPQKFPLYAERIAVCVCVFILRHSEQKWFD